jgi:hypothetical protein
MGQKNMKIAWLGLTMMAAGCTQIGAMAPNYAIGTYSGAVIASGACPTPAAELTVGIELTAANGNWYFEQQNVQAQFGDGWVNPGGFVASRYATGGGMEYVYGTFVNGGTAIDATIDMRGCLYFGRIMRT